jgi:transposase
LSNWDWAVNEGWDSGNPYMLWINDSRETGRMAQGQCGGCNYPHIVILLYSCFHFIQLPLMTPFPGPLSVIILNNAPIHHTQEIYDTFDCWGKSLLAAYHPCISVLSLSGAQTEYLPPYFPDLNPIKETFSKIKAFICRHSNIFTKNPGNLYDLWLAMEIITPENALGYISHAGYSIA